MSALALIGSGEFTSAMDEVDRFLLDHTPNPKVAILPTAANLEPNWRKWVTDGVRHFSHLGVSAEGVNPLDPVKLKQFNFFYFSGGDPGHLLKSLKNTPVWKTILDLHKSGATLVGSSAGAMVFGKSVWASVYKFINEGLILPWVPGLGLVDFGIIPHYDAISNDFTKLQVDQIKSNFPKDVLLSGIDENTAYVKIRDKWSTLGAGQVLSL